MGTIRAMGEMAIPTKQVDFSLLNKQAKENVKETLKEFIAWYTE
jgi:hypothetical protein